MYENENYSGYSTYNTSSNNANSGAEGAYSSMNHSSGAGGSEPKKKNSGGFFKRALLSISLGLFFGIFAGVGFYAVQQATGLLNPVEKTPAITEQVQMIPEHSEASDKENI